MNENSENLQIKLARKYLKMKIIEDKLTFRGFKEQRAHLRSLMLRTVESAESNSAIVVGPRGSGKSTMVNNTLWEARKSPDFERNCIVVELNGNVHNDDKLAIKAITAQMRLESAVDNKVFGTFAENLSFLLSCLKSGCDDSRKSVVFILEEFDLFCRSHGSQTLLYNLFDVAQSRQAPICVIGVTCRLDVVELLEKRVKSRFSHRQIFVMPNEEDDDTGFKNRRLLFKDLLSLPMEIIQQKSPSKRSNQSNEHEIPYEILIKCKTNSRHFTDLDPIFVSCWNENIENLVEDDEVVKCLENLYDLNTSEEVFRKFLFRLVCKVSSQHPQIDAIDVVQLTQHIISTDDKVSILNSLSVLEISLVITMKHQAEIFNNQPMNFEMVLTRYNKFAGSSAHTIPRAVILKAFEHLQSLELIAPIKGEVGMNIGYVQKEYRLFKLLVTPFQITEAIKNYKSLPTDIAQWAYTSV